MSVGENALKFLSFVSGSPSPFHAIDQCKQKLVKSGFKELVERNSWPPFSPGDKLFYTRNNSSIVAFTVGGRFVSGNGFTIVAAHSDSPCLKLKPISKKSTSKGGYQQVKVQTYGGGLWYTWFDRDLSVAGRIVSSAVGDAGVKEHLFNINKPIMRISSLAIHLDRSVDSGFTFNKETHLLPVIGLADKALAAEDQQPYHHSPALLNEIEAQTGVAKANILDLEACLYDHQAPSLGGINNEFVYSARLDNLLMSFCALDSFLGSAAKTESQDNINVMVLFDNEEIGSQSAYGAGSNLLSTALERILASLNASDKFHQSIQKSILVSADCAHAIHPNYADKHEDNHAPEMDKGVVIKINANQRYATTSVTSALIKKIAQSKGIPLQEFVVRNDSPCGSTIGPILSASLGMRTIDVGNAQLSMHSIREVCSVKDITNAINLFKEIYETFPQVDV